MIVWPLPQWTCTVPKEQRKCLDELGESFTAHTFDWQKVKSIGLVNKCLPEARAAKATCGKLLLHAKTSVDDFREKMGVRLCVFKVGVTSNPLKRYPTYWNLGFHAMWLIATSHSIDLIHMLEAALIMEYHKHVGCRNQKGTGGEGYLNRKNIPPGPYYVYITGGRADQPRAVG